MATGVVTWSKTAASNGTADSNVNWSEGMAPSAVNDSARSEMASVAKWRDDINGSIATAGTQAALTVTTNQTFGSLAANNVVAFCPHTTNTATVTLNVDSLGAKPIRSGPGSAYELPAGTLVQGTPYVVTYYSSNGGEWILHGFYGNPYNIPLGGMMEYIGATAPNSNFVLPYGQAISRSTYTALFSLVSTTFGGGDGSTTFNVPDLRGRASFCPDGMGGTAASRITATAATLGTAFGTESLAIAQANLPNVNLTTNITDNRTWVGLMNATSVGSNLQQATGTATPVGAAYGQSIQVSGTITGSTPLGGSGTPYYKMPPGMFVNKILRVI